MGKHMSRTLLIYGVVVLSIIYIYPTLGWMTLSEAERAARLEQWQKEDTVYEQPSFWRDTWKPIRRWVQCDRSWVINLGLDLRGGVHMVLGLDLGKLDPERKQQFLDQGYSEENIEAELQQIALQRIRRRVAEFEAQEPIIQTLGTSQIQVQLPGERDIQRAKNLIMKTAYLTFNIVSGQPGRRLEETDKVFRAIEQRFPKRFVPFLRKPTRGGSGFYEVPLENIARVRQVVEEASAVPGLIPEDKIIAFSQPPNPWDEPRYEVYLMDKQPVMTGEGLRLAVARPDQEKGGVQWMILFEWDAQSAARFAEVTEANLLRSMAIVLDGVVVSAPTIQSRIYDRGQITGTFSREQAQDLGIALNSGSMPVPIREDFTAVVGPSLGADSIRKGVISSLVSLAMVLLFMVVYYRVAGMIANISLLVNALMMLSIMAYFDATLTLPGIAGFILTMGMSVDGNVLIYERIREESRTGKSLAAAVDRGFSRAAITILDSQLTTLLAAVILYQFGTGPVQGYATALSIGVVCSIFTSIVVSRAQFDFLIRRRWLSKLTMMTLMKPDTHIRFLDRRILAIGLSTAMILVGMVMFTLRGSANFGVDFTSGTNMIVSLDAGRTIEVGQVRTKLAEAGFRDVVVQEYEESGAQNQSRFLLRLTEVSAPSQAPAAMANPSAGDQTISGRVQSALAVLCGSPEDGSKVALDRVETIGPAVGAELKRDAVAANVYSWVFMIIYLWFRFELRYGVAAVVALVHDVLVTLCLFALTGREITMPVVAAMLTIIGYSVNDTIVIFDRVRENTRLYRGRDLSYLGILDLSINQTMSRTLLTSFTVLLVVVVMFFFGGEVLHDFAFALIVGVFVGTYSTVFIAGPVAYYWQRLQTHHKALTGGGVTPKKRLA